MSTPLVLSLFAIIAAAALSQAAPPDTVTVTVIASGETHAMLDPCDCPVEPGGGLAQRALVLGKYGDPAARLLLDAGGFGGGGIYDNYTGGRALDSLRTLATVSAMGFMKYDAAAIGDDDLIYGGRLLMKNSETAGLPLVSANVAAPGRKPLAPAYRVIVRRGVRFGVAALTTQERLFKGDDSCVAGPPVSSLRGFWKEIVAASDYQIILSHLGEEMAGTLVDSFPECDIIVNGHRKTSALPVVRFGKTLVMQFGFEGKKLSFAKIVFDKKAKTFQEEKSGWVEVARGTAPDSAVASIVNLSARQEAKPVYDLYIMSDCQYGCEALREFADFIALFPPRSVEWNIWFIGTDDNGSLISLHGKAEADDEMAWLAVHALYPGKWLPFLAERSRPGATTPAVLAKLSLDTNRIKKWVREKGFGALAGHYQRTMRLSVSASPTLVINNSPFEKKIESRRLAKGLCLTRKKAYQLCDSLAECFDDGDCVKKGFTGSCSDRGACVFAKDAVFNFLVLVADSTLQHPEKAVLATTEELFPAVAVEIVTLGSKKGRELYKKHAPLSLPLYLFGAGVAQARNFSRVESGLVRTIDAFTFRNSITQVNYFPARVGKPGTALFLIDPFFPDAAQALQTITGRFGKTPDVRVLPVIYSDPSTGAPSVDEKLRREEALRWMVMDTLFPDKYFSYLAASAKSGPSSYWFLSTGETGIAQDRLVDGVRSRGALLTGQWKLLQELGLKDPIAVILNNRELVIIRNEKELASVLEKLAGRK